MDQVSSASCMAPFFFANELLYSQNIMVCEVIINQFEWVFAFMNWFMTVLWRLFHKVYFRHNDCIECYTTHTMPQEWKHSKTKRKVRCLIQWWKINPVLHQTALQIHLTGYIGSRVQILVWICIGFDGGRGISIHSKNAEAQGGTKLNC